MPFVDDQGKEALNFNITVGIAFFVLFLLAVLTLGIGLVIAIPLWIIIGIAWLVFTLIAAIKANEGVAYRYPFTLRLVKWACRKQARGAERLPELLRRAPRDMPSVGLRGPHQAPSRVCGGPALRPGAPDGTTPPRQPAADPVPDRQP